LIELIAGTVERKIQEAVMIKTDQAVEEFLRQTLVGVISTIDKNDHPRTAPIWFHWENGAAYMFTDRNSLKWRNIQHNPHTSLCVDWREPPYRSVILDGLVEEVDRSLYELVLMMALRYYGEKVGTTFAEGYKDQSANVAAFRLIPQRIANYLK